MYRIKYSFLVLALLGICIQVAAQNDASFKESVGDKYYNNLNFIKAISVYEEVVSKDASNTRVLPKLGDSYRKVGDMKNAERVFGILMLKDSATTAANVLSYAQALAVNKKYDESLVYYRKYAAMRPDDARGQAFVKAYSNMDDFYKDSTRRNVQLANFNSGQSDFSPAYYKKGLVFCSNRMMGTNVKRVFEWNQSAFLDLYYIADTASIKPVSIDTANAYVKKRKIKRNDDDTYETPNDTKVAGFTTYNYLDTSGLFETTPVVVEHFSKKLESKYHEGPLSFFKNQDSVIFTRNNYNNGKYREGDDGINKLKLYSSVYKDGAWRNVTSLPFNNNNYSVGHPALVPGDSVMYFVSDMPGGLGGTDIYKVSYSNGVWSVPVNVGAPINTAGNESFPYVDALGDLYFASDGHPGLGGLDIFTTPLSKINIRNMGYPVNSSYDDFGIALDKTTATGFFSSNRRRGFSDDDIYSVGLEKPMAFIVQVMDSATNRLIPLAKALITDAATKERQATDSSRTGRYNAALWNHLAYNIAASADGYDPRSVSVVTDISNPVITIKLVKLIEGCIVAGTITDKDTKLPVAGAQLVIYDRQTKDTVYNITVGDDGKYRFVSLKANRMYDMSVSSQGYFNKPAIQLSTKGAKCLSAIEREYDYLRDFQLEQIIVGKAIKIDNIYFDLNKYEIRKDAAKELDKIVALMKENPDIIIELGSHTDCRSSYQYNMTLSDNRAKASAAYIVTKGIAVERITGKGYGETKLVNDCACEGKVVSRVCTDAEHQANRRTEFQVIGFLSDKNTQILNGGRGETPSSVPEPVKE
jgi:outer membrane protein OmpA-like peptidoglycan-associated protein/tetratricopeptide (TPR) repeat protein